MIADAWAPFPSDPSAAEPHRARREPGVHGPKARDRRRKTGRSIRCAARIRPLGKNPNRFRAFAADGRQPFMPATVSQPLPLSLIPSFRLCEAVAAAFRRARESAIHPATIIVPRLRFFVKEFQKKVCNGFVRLVESGDGPLSYGTAMDVGCGCKTPGSRLLQDLYQGEALAKRAASSSNSSPTSTEARRTASRPTSPKCSSRATVGAPRRAQAK